MTRLKTYHLKQYEKITLEKVFTVPDITLKEVRVFTIESGQDRQNFEFFPDAQYEKAKVNLEEFSENIISKIYYLDDSGDIIREESCNKTICVNKIITDDE